MTVKRPTDRGGLVALVLAFGVTVALVDSAIAASIRGHEFTPDEITLLSTITGTSIGAVATYLGMSRRNNHHHHHDDDDKVTLTETPPAPEPEPTSESAPEPDPEFTDEQADEMTQGMGPGDDDETA